MSSIGPDFPLACLMRSAFLHSQAEDLVNPRHLSDVEMYMTDRAESIYRTVKEEPLGKTFSRGYSFPERVMDPQFRFGVTTATSEESKEVIYPKNAIQNDEHSQKLYRRTHGSFESGEQESRDYDWARTQVKDPHEFRFGLKLDAEIDGAKKCIHPER